MLPHIYRVQKRVFKELFFDDLNMQHFFLIKDFMPRDIKSVKFFNVYGYKTILFNKESRSAIHRILTFKKVIFLNKSYIMTL